MAGVNEASKEHATRSKGNDESLPSIKRFMLWFCGV